MKAASLADIRQELKTRNTAELLEICLRLARAKKENKELLNYLLFEAYDMDGYLSQLKEETDTALATANRHNLYLLKKQLRKILSNLNRYLKYTASKAAEAEMLLYFCTGLHRHHIPYSRTTALSNIYEAQLKKIAAAISTLHQDLQHDYLRQLNELK